MVLPGLNILPAVITRVISSIMGICIQVHSFAILPPRNTVYGRCWFYHHQVRLVLLFIGRIDHYFILCAARQREGITVVNTIGTCFLQWISVAGGALDAYTGIALR